VSGTRSWKPASDFIVKKADKKFKTHLVRRVKAKVDLGKVMLHLH